MGLLNTKFKSYRTYGGEAATIMTSKQRELIVGLWKVLEPNRTVFGKQIFLHIFAENPEVKKLFPFRNAWGDELITHPQFQAHSARFMRVIHQAIAHLVTIKVTFIPVLKELGAKHTKMHGFSPQNFMLFKDSTMYILKREYPTTMTPECTKAWEILFDFILEQLKDGYLERLAINQLKAMEEADQYIHISNT